MATITCYGYDGVAFPDLRKCPNSDSCCPDVGQCTSQRLCQSSSGLTRPACVNNPYTNETCADICLFKEHDGVLPRIIICPDGTYCCARFANCCDNGQGIVLNSYGDRVIPASKAASTTAIISSSSSLPSSTTNSAGKTTAAASSTSHPSTQSSSLSTGSKIGIGAGAAAGTIVLLSLIVLMLIRRRKSRQAHLDCYAAKSPSSTTVINPGSPAFEEDETDQQQMRGDKEMREHEETSIRGTPVTRTLTMERQQTMEYPESIELETRPPLSEMDVTMPRVNGGMPFSGNQVHELDGWQSSTAWEPDRKF